MCAWVKVAAVAGTTLLGGIAGSQKQTQTAVSEPWGPQQPYLTHGFDKAKAALDSALPLGAYTGKRVADMHPYQSEGYSGIVGFASEPGTGMANKLLDYAQQALNQGHMFGANANSMYGEAGMDSTYKTITNAGQYANSPYLNGQIDAASRDVGRYFREEMLPGLDQGAAMTGNMNSSRAGVAQGVMTRGVEDRLGDIASTMRGNAYDNGLTLAQNQYNNSFVNKLNANGQLLQSAVSGLNAANAGLDAGYTAYGNMAYAGNALQNHEQNVLNADHQAFNEQQNVPLDLVGKYMSVINGNYGGTQRQTSGGGAGGALQGALTGLTGGLGLVGRMGV